MGCSGNSSSHFLASSPVSRTERSPAGCGSLWAGALARLVGELANVWLVCLAPALPGQARLMMMMIVVAVPVPVGVPVAVLLQPSLSLSLSLPPFLAAPLPQADPPPLCRPSAGLQFGIATRLPVVIVAKWPPPRLDLKLWRPPGGGRPAAASLLMEVIFLGQFWRQKRAPR